MFGGEKRTKQYGYTSATLNLVLMACVIATGYLAKISWRLPFMIYLLPIVPLFFAKRFGKYIPSPKPSTGQTKEKYKFSQQVDVWMLTRYCLYYFFITLVIASISMYIPFRFTNSSTAGDLTSILFFGIMASGYTLNWCVKKLLRGHVAIPVMVFTVLGFAIISLFKSPVLVGIGILIATYFYGIAQPYYYDRLSVASTRIALTLTLAIFASMDSIGNVVAPFVIDAIAKIFHHSTSSDPNIAFWICTWMSVAVLAAVIVYEVIVHARKHVASANTVKLQASTAAHNAKSALESEARIAAANTANNHPAAPLTATASKATDFDTAKGTTDGK